MNWLKRWRGIIVILFILLVVLVGITGYNIVKNNQDQIRKGVEKELQTIAQLKIDQISEWYQDELYDASGIAQNNVLIKNIESWMDRNDSLSMFTLTEHLNNLANENSLDEIFLVSTGNEFLLSSTGESYFVDSVVSQTIETSLQTKTSQSTDLYLCKQSNSIHIDFVAPVMSSSGSLLCTIVFVVNANQFLYPYIQKWPLPSKTAETLILRKEKDHILFLNELRHVRGSALNLRIPMSATKVPAIQAVNGYVGIFEGLDYRSVKVLSYVDKIPGTPWYTVAKIDKSELYERANLSRNMAQGLVMVLILMLFLAFAFIYSHLQKSNYKKLWQSQQAFRTILYSIGDAVITTDKEGRVMNLNVVAEKLTGWTELEAIGQPISEVFNIISEINRKKAVNPVHKVITEGVIVNLANHTLLISKDGHEIPIADSGAPIYNEAGEVSGVILVFRDQTEERDQQKLIEEQRRQLFTLMSNLPGIAYRCLNNQNWTMEFISKGCLELTGYDVEELIGNRKISFAEIIAEEFRDQIWQKVQEAISLHENFELEYQIITKRGNRKWVWEKGQGVFGENNELLAIEGFISDVDQRKTFEFALKESEKQFQTIAENSSVGIFKTNAKGKTIYVNPKWCEISGVGPDVAFGEGWLNQVYPDDRETLVANWTKNLENKITSKAEYRFIHSNGDVVFVKGQAVPEFNDKNELMGYIGTITDVTDIKEAEEKLISANLLMNTLINNIPDAVYIKDINGRKILANKADLLNIGADNEDEVIGKTDFEVFPEPIARQFWETDLNVMQKGEAIINHEEELINEKGQVKWLLTSKIPYRDSEGRILGLIGIGHDITRRKQDDEEKSKLFTILSQSPVSIVITNPKGEIEYVNPKFTEVSGYNLDEVIGKNPRVLKSGNHSPEFYKDMWKTISEGAEFRGEIENKKKNGELYWENAIIAPVRNNQGRIINYVGVKEDITDKKKLMQDLIAAKNKAEESDRLKTSFLANMSHEIRTPLNSILGFSNILVEAEDVSENEKQEYVSIISKSSESLLQIINDIIDISSLETGQLKIFLSSFNVNDLINILFREFERRLDELKIKDIQLHKLNVDSDIQLFTDQNRLNQIFINLLTNAIKFTSQGFIAFGIEKCDDQFVYFKVQDTGIGISKENHSVIFERFRQAEDNNTRSFGGNGLGLSIVKNLIELMGGKIALESEPGKGSTFRFFLPYKFPQS